MSHSRSSTCEPNLTPLLDIVLQLLMFFILITRFVSVSQNPEPPPDDDPSHTEIVLPTAESASPLDKGSSDYVFLLVNREGTFFFPFDKVGERSFDDVVGEHGWLYELWRDRQTAGEETMPTVIIKAHGELKAEQFAKILDRCQTLKMFDVRVRVEQLLVAPS
jgi:biopolymer transport protein ExbD